KNNNHGGVALMLMHRGFLVRAVGNTHNANQIIFNFDLVVLRRNCRCVLLRSTIFWSPVNCGLFDRSGRRENATRNKCKHCTFHSTVLFAAFARFGHWQCLVLHAQWSGLSFFGKQPTTASLLPFLVSSRLRSSAFTGHPLWKYESDPVRECSS